MSGSGGGRDDDSSDRLPIRNIPAGRGGEGNIGDDPCAIFQRAPLNSPRPSVVATLNIGDVLNIVLNEATGRPILEVHANVGIAGALTHNGHLLLVECIRQGRQYIAEVTGRAGGAVDLQISPA